MTEASILARLAAIEQQNQQVLIILAKLAGIHTPQVLEGLPPAEAQLIALAKVDRAGAIAESKRRFLASGKKKPSRGGVRA